MHNTDMDNSLVTVMGFTFNIYGAIILGILLFLVGAFWHAQKKGHLNWTDMITRDGNKVSATKVLQLVGGLVGTWIMIQMTLKNTLNWDMFAIYLGYVASIDGFSKLVLAKYGAPADAYKVQQDSTVSTTSTTITATGTPPIPPTQ